MFNFIILIMIFFCISILLFIFNFTFSKKIIKNREKNSSFECGFDPMSNTRIPFSIQFFLISLMFLIFDIEITMLIPLTFNLLYLNLFMVFSFLFFMIILIFSIYYEYMENMLEWKIF
uniref:NADH-ubiquinone oxidoreductase chain 3 n=1 Tax=Ectomomyrmex javanus TaxID=2571052 RepID=A0A4D6NZ95_9HYME|nr:NADH dehydrogenase subunit 3 [Ectomomyrmex javanus]QCE31828.1 NADH dehydrogenase subunit 3 [Ectomomyrmex javanus]